MKFLKESCFRHLEICSSDPDFQDFPGGAKLRRGAPVSYLAKYSLLFGKIFAENCKKMKEKRPRAVADLGVTGGWAPSQSNLYHFYAVLAKIMPNNRLTLPKGAVKRHKNPVTCSKKKNALNWEIVSAGNLSLQYKFLGARNMKSMWPLLAVIFL